MSRRPEKVHASGIRPRPFCDYVQGGLHGLDLGLERLRSIQHGTWRLTNLPEAGKSLLFASMPSNTRRIMRFTRTLGR
jgi:hypothetical protein